MNLPPSRRVSYRLARAVSEHIGPGRKHSPRNGACCPMLACKASRSKIEPGPGEEG